MLLTDLVVVQGESCGVVGNVSREFDIDRAHGFYLNTQDPSPCNGTVDEFQYCYYRPSNLAARYDFTFAVFRETSPGSYSAVSEAYTTGRTLTNLNLGSGDFACARFEVMNQVQIQAEDVIGACVYDPPNTGGLSGVRAELNVVGGNAGNNRYLMLTGNAGCDDFTVPSPVAVSGLARIDSHVLHISASISKGISTFLNRSHNDPCHSFISAPLPTVEPPTSGPVVETTVIMTNPPFATPLVTMFNSAHATFPTTTTVTHNQSTTIHKQTPVSTSVIATTASVLGALVVLVVVAMFIVVFAVMAKKRWSNIRISLQESNSLKDRTGDN